LVADHRFVSFTGLAALRFIDACYLRCATSRVQLKCAHIVFREMPASSSNVAVGHSLDNSL
jgi:hypothetical protein